MLGCVRFLRINESWLLASSSLNRGLDCPVLELPAPSTFRSVLVVSTYSCIYSCLSDIGMRRRVCSEISERSWRYLWRVQKKFCAPRQAVLALPAVSSHRNAAIILSQLGEDLSTLQLVKQFLDTSHHCSLLHIARSLKWIGMHHMTLLLSTACVTNHATH